MINKKNTLLQAVVLTLFMGITKKLLRQWYVSYEGKKCRYFTSVSPVQDSSRARALSLSNVRVVLTPVAAFT